MSRYNQNKRRRNQETLGRAIGDFLVAVSQLIDVFRKKNTPKR